MQCWRWSPSPPQLPSLFNSSSSLFAANILPIAAPLEESLPHSVPLTPIPPTPLFLSLSISHFYLACRFVFSTPSSTASCNNIAPSLFAEAKVVSFLVSFAILRVSWLRECVYVLKWQEFFFASVICERFCIGSGVVVPRIGVRWIGESRNPRAADLDMCLWYIYRVWILMSIFWVNCAWGNWLPTEGIVLFFIYDMCLWLQAIGDEAILSGTLTSRLQHGLHGVLEPGSQELREETKIIISI